MKRAAEPAGGGFPKRTRAPRTGQFAFKVLCPDNLVANVVGSSGATVSRIQDASGAHLTFSRRGEYYPDTRLRTLVISGAAPEEILRALEEVLDIIVNCGDEERQALEAAGTLEEGGDFLDASGDSIIRCALTSAAASTALGLEGDGVAALLDETGARLQVEEEICEDHQLATLAGDRQQLVAALERLSALVQADAEEAWFSEWADRRSFGGPGADGGGAGDHRRGGREGEPRRGDAGGSQGSTVFVGGLTQATQPAALRAYFERYGRVVEADVKMDQRTGRSKGFGFVTFSDPRAVERCLERPKEHVVNGKWVDVKRYGDSGDARPPTEPPPPRGRAHADERDDGYGAHRPHERSGRPADPPHRWEREEPRGPDRGAPRGGGGGGHRDDHRGDHRGDYRSERSAGGPGQPGRVDISRFVGLARAVPSSYLGLDYCISCSLPSAQCGALIGRRGERVMEVERRTGARVDLSKKDPVSGHSQLSLVGSLISVYAAHMLLMQIFNDATNPAQDAGPPDHNSASHIEDLRRQIDALKSKLPQRR